MSSKRSKNVILILAAAIILIGLYFVMMYQSGIFDEDPVVEAVPDNCYQETLHVITDQDYSPYSFYDADHNPSGYDIEFVTLLANHMKMNLDLKMMDWNAGIAAIVAGKADVLMTCDYTDSFAGTDKLIKSLPTSIDEFSVYARKPIKSINTLYGKRIGIMSNGNVTPLVQRLGLRPFCIEYADNRAAMQALVDGKVDAAIIRQSVGTQLIEDMNITGVQAYLAAERSYMCYGINPDEPGMAERINQAITDLKIKGEHDRLSEKWLTTFIRPYTLAEVMQQNLWIVFFVILLIVFTLAAIYGNKQRELNERRENEKKLSQQKHLVDYFVQSYSSAYFVDLVNETFEVLHMANDHLGVFKMDGTRADMANFIREHIHPDDQEMMTRMTDKDYIAGRLRWTDNIAFAVREVFNDDVHYMKGMIVRGIDENHVALGFMDITGETVKESEQQKRLQQNFDIIQGLASEYSSVYYLDLVTDEFTPYSMNSVTESALGLIFRQAPSVKDAFKTYVDKCVLREDRPMMMKATSIDNIKQELKNKKSFVTTFRDRDGHYNEMKIVKAGSDNAKPKAITLGFADKDALIRAEMQRQAIAERDAAVISGLSDDFGGVMYVNTDTKEEVHYRFDELLTSCVPQWTQINDFDERLSALWKHAVHPDDKDSFRSLSRESILDIIKREGVFYHNFRVVVKGRIKYYQLKLIRDEHSENHIIAGFRNVDQTMRREMEYQEKLELANKSKTDFLFNMSHDIRTPMNAIIGFTQMARKNVSDRDRVTDCLYKIEDSSNHLLDLINEVLDMSRVESGKLHSELKTINVIDAAKRLMVICLEEARQNYVNMSFSDRGVTHRTVTADELHINQILMNILGNAIKYTKPGGDVRFSVVEKPSDVPAYGKYVFTVADTGIGMSKEFVDRIYEAFSREENASISRVQGTGLGMAIVKRLIDYMDGNIDIQSTPGKGTTVTVTLHLLLANDDDNSAKPKTTTDEKAIDLRGKKLLLVEDNELNREIATSILTEQGLVVEEAVNGIDAVEHVSKRGATYYDFILMDIQMPMMDGFEATREIRRMTGASSLPIIALSANAFEEDRRRSLEAGMDDHVAKPIDMTILLSTLARFAKK